MATDVHREAVDGFTTSGHDMNSCSVCQALLRKKNREAGS